MKNNSFLLVLGFILIACDAYGVTIKIQNESGKPLSLVMVTESVQNPLLNDTSDGGYQKPNIPQIVAPEITKFCNKEGEVAFTDRGLATKYRFRKVNFKDLEVSLAKGQRKIRLTMKRESDLLALAEAKPANVWLGALDVGPDEDKIIFKMQCGYCHQQGSSFLRQERSESDWNDAIKRMIRYGSRLPTDLQKSLPKILFNNYRKLRENPSLLENSKAWEEDLLKVTITEWPIGDSMSQIHDMVVAANKLIYVADNIQDRLYQVNPISNEVTVFKIPHHKNDVPGGLISGRLKDFPRHDSTSNAHSLAQSKKDGHIFITPSAQRRLIEFDPLSKKFTLHEMKEGFYPHTIRIDSKDNVWFTLALSNQVAKFDRVNKKFTYYDLPARNFKEKILTKNIHLIFKLINLGLPLSNWLPIDRVSSGVPLAYGIDITPDDKVWFTRLHTKEIGVIDPATGGVTMIPTPFWGPRRLRSDKDGNLWVTSFGESKIARYTPRLREFKLFDLPVIPEGSDTPYSLNIDLLNNAVWVNGNQSDSLHVLDMKSQNWRSIPLPRRITFTRDIDFDHQGTAYTSNSNFPSWHIEGQQPTLIQVKRK